MTSHTPGPWEIYDCESAIRVGIEGGNGTSVVAFGAKGDDAGVWGGTKDQAKANARLIASAPELLEALKRLVDLHVATYGLDGAWDEELNNAQKAIAKAEGKL
jgi:hypothetical protein